MSADLKECLFQAQNAAMDLTRQLVATERRLNEWEARLVKALKIVDEQANDPALWCVAENIMEAYFQQELRRLHAALEAP